MFLVVELSCVIEKLVTNFGSRNFSEASGLVFLIKFKNILLTLLVQSERLLRVVTVRKL